ncbi:MAG: hypothetical protein U5K43_10070 [Halofilum sp. (in: g-proteobacteria)]|nr:hypothetical protein [Halofilum sp. (in: g-proteobacteria)]
MGTGPTWLIVFTDQDVHDYRSHMAEDTSLKRRFFNGLYRRSIHIIGRGSCTRPHG